MGNVIFVVIFVIFCAFLLGAGLISKRWVKESSDFVLAGREISTPINVVGVIAIGFAGTTVTLAPGFTIQYGLLGGLGWGVIYSVCGLLIFGLLYSNFVRRSGAQTLPEFLEMRYDGHTRSVVAITSVIGMCGIMANNVVSSVDNIAAFTGWNRLAITAIIFAVIIVFTFVSGLWATTITDLFQVLIGVIVVPATFFILAGRFGWLDAISANWGAGDFMSQGFVGALPGMKLTYPSVFNFIICFAVALVWGNNYYWMKVANCRSEKVARRSFVAAAIILIVVFMVPLCFIGGYMGAFYPEQLTLNGGTVAPTGTYGYVAKTFVSLFGSLVVISAVAASISTASTSALGASAVANRDIYQRLINPKADAKKSLKMSKIIMLLIGAVFGLLAGTLIEEFNMQPFIATLSTMFLARGLASIISTDSLTFPQGNDFSFISNVIKIIDNPKISNDLSFNVGVIIALVVVVFGYVFLHHTRTGRTIYAIGGSRSSAELMGLPVKRTQYIIYLTSATLAALASIVYTANIGSAKNTVGVGWELDAVASVVIGGTIITGGFGYVLGSVLGSLVRSILDPLTSDFGVPAEWTTIVIGLMILVFVVLQRAVMAVGGDKK